MGTGSNRAECTVCHEHVLYPVYKVHPGQN